MRKLEAISRLEIDMLVRALDAAEEPLEIDDLQGRILFVNDAWCQMFCRARQEVTGVTWETLQVGGEAVTELRSSWARCIAEGHSAGTFSLRWPDGTSRPVSCTRRLHRDEDGVATVGVTVYRPSTGPATANDVARQEMAKDESLETSEQAPKRLEHRLRNLLTIIVANLELLDRATDKGIRVRRLALIENAARGAMDILGGGDSNTGL